MPKSAPCEFLDWDTAFFGCRIARVVGHRLSLQSLRRVLQWCKSHQIECLYFLADAVDPGTTQHAEDHGFRLVDIRITFQCVAGGHAGKGQYASSEAVQIRPFRGGDLPQLRDIARDSHRDSRFYFDGQFPVELCDTLYQVWIERSCTGYANTVLVADVAGQPSGYISCHLPGKDSYGRIGLVGVAPSARGHGVGRALVSHGLDWFAGHSVDLVQVATQGRNTAAQRLYQRCGFLTHEVQLWFHKWMPPYNQDKTP